jgi:hypothetical protein
MISSVSTSANRLDILGFFCQMKDAGATVFGINKINQDTGHPYICQLLHKHQGCVWDNSKLQYSSSKIDIGKLCKRRGALLGMTGSISSQVINNFSDDMGGWCGVTLLHQLAKKYTIICAYRVPLVSGISGPSMSHTQQPLMLKLAEKLNQRPRHHFCTDLKFLLDKRIKDNHEVILMGDFNNKLGSSVRGIAKVVADCNLVDVYAAKHALEEEVPTYSRGTKQLDYILMTPTVPSHVARCRANPFNHQFFWDHRGIYVDLELKGLFDQNLP